MPNSPQQDSHDTIQNALKQSKRTRSGHSTTTARLLVCHINCIGIQLPDDEYILVLLAAKSALMKANIRQKIQVALASKSTLLKTEYTVPETPETGLVVDEVLAEEKFWEVRDIAARHGLNYSTIWRHLKGKPGWIRHGRVIRITDALYKAYIRQSVCRGLADKN